MSPSRPRASRRTPEVSAESELRLRLSGLPALGARQVLLLKALKTKGSLNQAASDADITYRTAWTWVENLNRVAREPLVEAVRGGSGGGGTSLTPYGERILALYDLLEEEGRRRESRWSGELEALFELFRLARRASLRTSARNQLHGEVIEIVAGKVAADVRIVLAGGDEVVAQITLGSIGDLGLAPGVEVWALVKAQSILLSDSETPPPLSARNRLLATVESVLEGAVNSDVTLSLPGRANLASIVTCESARLLDLAPGKRIWAIFDAQSVIIGVGG